MIESKMHLYHGWNVERCLKFDKNFQMYSLKKNKDGCAIYSTLFIVFLKDKKHLEMLEDSVDFLSKSADHPNILKIYEYHTEQDENSLRLIVRTETCYPISSMAFDENQIIDMAQNMADVCAYFRSKFWFMNSLDKNTVFMVPSGAFKLGDFTNPSVMKTFISLNQDIMDLGNLLESCYDKRKKMDPEFEKFIICCKKEAFKDTKEVKKALANLKTKNIQRKAKKRKRYITAYLSSTFLFLCLFSAVVLNLLQQPDSHHMQFASVYEDVLTSVDQHQQKEKNVVQNLSKNNWKLSEDTASEDKILYTKDITGGYLEYMHSNKNKAFSIYRTEAFISFNDIVSALEGIAPDIVKYGFIAMDDVHNYLGISDSMKDWLKEKAEISPWKEETGCSYHYDSKNLHISFHEDYSAQTEYYVLSDYDSGLILKTAYENQNKPVSYTFEFY